MTKNDLAQLAHEIEAALELNDSLRKGAVAAISAVSGEHKIASGDLDSTDKVLAAIYAIKPGWAVSMKGAAQLPNGHWHCTLRQASFRDDDAFIGMGRGPTLAHSLLAALLKVVAYET